MGIDELTLADSAGMGNPQQIERTLRQIKLLAGDTPIVMHLHDTRGMGLANCYAALRCGVTHFDTSFGGLGGCPFIEGAKGNIPTEDTLYMMNEMGIDTAVDIGRVSAVAQRYETFFGEELPGKIYQLGQ